MANNLKELLNRPLPRDDKNRASLFAVISGYLLYMAWEVLRDATNGVSSMSVEASVACAAFLALGGLGTLAWTIRLWRRSKEQRNRRKNPPDQASFGFRRKASKKARLSSRE